ncbi:hypothetical protein B0T21DRAFT_125585 [Apiosordaria backusii]|uniref:F-box domain-containing protein n=1 Tax=Apiosordaria backusii TaxID=314023 RepID=A0AA40EMS2_9PEZI|nr:hypothetical protein B0T21DRAFT_125585 [Apiosordaria backusii]
MHRPIVAVRYGVWRSIIYYVYEPRSLPRLSIPILLFSSLSSIFNMPFSPVSNKVIQVRLDEDDKDNPVTFMRSPIPDFLHSRQSSENIPCHLIQVPLEILLHILDYIRTKDLIPIASVNRYLRNIACRRLFYSLDLGFDNSKSLEILDNLARGSTFIGDYIREINVEVKIEPPTLPSRKYSDP